MKPSGWSRTASTDNNKLNAKMNAAAEKVLTVSPLPVNRTKRFNDLTGKKFGRWSVVGYSHTAVYPYPKNKSKPESKTRRPMWVCQCDCGVRRGVSGLALITGKSLSCGCFRLGLQRKSFRSGNWDDLTGKQFGYWTALRRIDHRQTPWLCRCACGDEHVRFRADLVSGRTRSCGCKMAELLSGKRVTHGASRKNGSTPALRAAYRSWSSMRTRCMNPRIPGFEHYGGRGICFCAGFETFENFNRVLGPRPLDKSLDRKDVNGNYSCGECDECKKNGWPLNVRWLSKKGQSNNVRSNVKVIYKGVTHNLSRWAEIAGIGVNILKSRIYECGWSMERAMLSGKPVNNEPPDRSFSVDMSKEYIRGWSRFKSA